MIGIPNAESVLSVKATNVRRGPTTMHALHKYPRTYHLEGSRLQPGDEGGGEVAFAGIAGRRLVVEEKLDGANAAVSFDAAGRLWLQSRGHFLTGGPREKHFNLFKQWAHGVADALRPALGQRYVLYGEWLYAKHTIYYDQLPHFFLEFDLLDTETGTFLATDRRRDLLHGLPVVSVPVLRTGPAENMSDLLALVGPSRFKGPDWREQLVTEADARGVRFDTVWRETNRSDLMEGLYVKVEEGGRVVERYKWVRADFLTAVVDSGSHWLQRPIIPNRLRAGAALS